MQVKKIEDPQALKRGDVILHQGTNSENIMLVSVVDCKMSNDGYIELQLMMIDKCSFFVKLKDLENSQKYMLVIP